MEYAKKKLRLKMELEELYDHYMETNDFEDRVRTNIIYTKSFNNNYKINKLKT